MNEITGIMVVCNESRHLKRSLPSLEFCKEVIVVDLESTDGSADLAHNMGARVVRHPRVPVVEEVREFAVNQSTTDWVVFLDPDMVLPSGAYRTIKKVIVSANDISTVVFPYRNYFMGKPVKFGAWGKGWYPLGFHRGRVRFFKSVHRGLERVSGFKNVIVPFSEQNHITHYWAEDFEEFLHKHRRYYIEEGRLLYITGSGFNWYLVAFNLMKNFFNPLIFMQGYKAGRIGVFFKFFSGVVQAQCRFGPSVVPYGP